MERTDPPAAQPSPRARANRILAVPATIALCRADYEQAADVRRTMAAQIARHR